MVIFRVSLEDLILQEVVRTLRVIITLLKNHIKNFAEGEVIERNSDFFLENGETENLVNLKRRAGSIRLDTRAKCSVVPTTRPTDMTERNRERSRAYPGMRQQNSSRRTHLLVTHRAGYPLPLTLDHTTDPS